jgi:hypothetical protein
MSWFDSSQETKISTEAAITHGIVSGVYYGGVWGLTSYWIQDYKNYRPHLQFSNPAFSSHLRHCLCRYVRCNINSSRFLTIFFLLSFSYTCYSIAGFASFLALFKGTNSVLLKAFPSPQYRPIFDGLSSSCAAVVPLWFESRNWKTAA